MDSLLLPGSSVQCVIVLVILIKTAIPCSMNCVHVHKQNIGFSSKMLFSKCQKLPMTYSVLAAVHGLFLYFCGWVCSVCWFGVVCLGFFFRRFFICVKIVVTSLWAKAKGLFGCLILFVCLFVWIKKNTNKKAYKPNQPNPPKIFCGKGKE